MIENYVKLFIKILLIIAVGFGLFAAYVYLNEALYDFYSILKYVPGSTYASYMTYDLTYSLGFLALHLFLAALILTVIVIVLTPSLVQLKDWLKTRPLFSRFFKSE